MSKYIDDVDFWLLLTERVFHEETDEYREARKCLEEIPAADVVEVRHGKWKMVRMPYGGIDAFCSYCNSNIWSEREWIDMSEEFKRFCPHCGAIMEGVFNV